MRFVTFPSLPQKITYGVFFTKMPFVWTGIEATINADGKILKFIVLATLVFF